MKIFITGVTGYIGHKLLLAAIGKGYSVQALVRKQLPQLPLMQQVQYKAGDITDFDSVMKAMDGCDAVMHAAGMTRLWHKDRSVFYKVNVEGTRNVLNAACHHGVKRLVFTSTCAVLGPSANLPLVESDPRVTAFENDYEISKHCAEELVKEYSRKGLFAVIVCPARVYGNGLNTDGNPITKLIERTLKRKLAFVPSAKNVLGNYAFVDDVVEGHFLAMQKGLGGEKYILGGENLSYQQFFETIQQAANEKIRLIAVPKPVLKLAGAFAYGSVLLTRKHIHLTPKTIDRLFQNRALSCEKAIRQLGYKITPFKTALYQTIQQLKSKSYA